MAEAGGAAPLCGGLLIDKPAGLTSHDVVAAVRREHGREVKVGHAGTLDPFATGLLIVLLGRATRLQRYLMPLPKTYVATARLGWRSSTGDPDGELTRTGKVPARLELPVGRVRQRLPMTSAVRVEGERLYHRAHRGETIETPEREATVYEARLLEREGELARFEVRVGAGTYVRTLIETLGDAYCAELRRTAIGPHRVEDSSPARLLEPRELLRATPSLEVGEADARRLSNGIRIDVGGEGAEEGSTLAVVRGEEVVCVARIEAARICPEVVLAPAS